MSAGIPTYYGDNKLLLTVYQHSTKPEGIQGHSLACPHDFHAGAHKGAYTLSRGCVHTLIL